MGARMLGLVWSMNKKADGTLQGRLKIGKRPEGEGARENACGQQEGGNRQSNIRKDDEKGKKESVPFSKSF